MDVRRRTVAAGAMLVAVAATAGLASGCGSAGSAIDPVAQAADATTHAGGAQVALSGSLSVAGLARPLTLSGSGSVNFRDGEGTFAMTVSGLPPGAQAKLSGSSIQLVEVFKAGDIYITSPLFTGKLPAGARWVKLDLAKFRQAMGAGTRSLTSGTDPTQYLAELRGSGGAVKVVGHETVRGVPTTRYAGTIDLVKAAELDAGANRAQARAAAQKLIEKTGQPSVPVQVWVDAGGLVRRVGLDLGQRSGGRAGSVNMQIEFFAFGAAPAATPPPAGEVYDATGVAIQGIGSG